MQRCYQRVSVLRLIPEELILFLIWCASCFLVLLVFDSYDSAFWITVAAITGLYLLTAGLYLPLLCFRTSYCLSGRQLRYRTGVFYQKDEVINREQIVYVTLVTNPFSPLLRIATVVIRAPGATIRLHGIRIPEAKRLVRQLSPEHEL